MHTARTLLPWLPLRVTAESTLYEDEQQNARETRSRTQIMHDALDKVNWQEVAEALREE